MKIFFVTNNYTPYTSGIVSSINAMTSALQAQGHEVFIITLNFVNAQKQQDPAYVIRIPCPIKFMYKKNYMAIPWRPTHAIKQLLQQHKPDIVHVHHPFLLGVSGLKAARAANIPCVFTYHTMYEDYAHYVPLLKNYSKSIIRMAVKHFCNTVDSIIVPSNAVKQYLNTQHITTPITVIPSPIRPFFFTDHVEKKISSSHKPFELLIVSRFTPEKNIPFVFEIFKQLPSTYHLTLVGYGSDYDAMQQLAFKTLQLSPQHVHFVHQPAQNNLLNLYKNADLFIFSSQTDTQGLVLAESMSQGVPVIAIDGPGQRDIIINGYNGFIINDAQQAATIITTIAQDTALHHKLTAGAYATAQRYHADTIIQQLLTLYHLTPSSVPFDGDPN